MANARSAKCIFVGKALTVSQPWASVIAFAGKDVENRTWNTSYRGRIAIHAGKVSRPKKEYKRACPGNASQTIAEAVQAARKKFKLPAESQDFELGQIVAIATLVDCTKKSSSKWKQRGSWGWVLEDVLPIEPITKLGTLGLWKCKFRYKPLKRKR